MIADMEGGIVASRKQLQQNCRRQGGVIERLEPRALLAGVTVITHGFQTSSALPNWLATMETALASRAGGANIYRMTITNSSSPTVSSFVRTSSGGSASGEAIVTVNWSAVANDLFGGPNTSTIAALVEPYLTVARNIPGDPLTARPLAELPVHLIGHSRGGSLVSDLARRLGASGIWTDQLTLLDPHPTNSDPAVVVQDNVVFSDDIFQTDGFPNGSAIAGSYGIDLTNVAGVNHSETHAYYHGTIARAAANDGDGITINNAWYAGAGQGPRAMVGYDWSRIGSAAQPAGGVGNLAGGSATRTHVTVTAASPWSNVGSLDVTGDAGGFVNNGSSINLAYRYQDSAGGGAISFYLDNDANPSDGFARSYGSSGSLAATGVTPNVSSVRSFPLTWNSAGLADGVYRVAAQITNASGKVRYAYATRPLYVSASGAELINKRWTNDMASNVWSDANNFTPGGLPAAGAHLLVGAGATTILSDAANQSLLVGGGASVTLGASQHLTGLTIAPGAAASLAANGNRFLLTGSLNLASTGKLDLADNDLIVNTGSFSTIRAAVLQGFGAGAAAGITSSTSNGSQILALFDNSLVGSATWNGQSISANAIVGKYTYFGDVNFDGQVTGDDYTIIDSNLNTTPPAGLAWLSGDANLDGIVTGDDYTTIDSNLGLGAGNPLSASAPANTLAQRRERDETLAGIFL